jgi:hypothetical protein
MTVVRERGNGNERHHSGGKDRPGQPGRRFSPRPSWNTPNTGGHEAHGRPLDPFSGGR